MNKQQIIFSHVKTRTIKNLAEYIHRRYKRFIRKHDKLTREKENFPIGQHVMVKIVHFKGTKAKLQKKFIGPYIIVRKNSFRNSSLLKPLFTEGSRHKLKSYWRNDEFLRKIPQLKKEILKPFTHYQKLPTKRLKIQLENKIPDQDENKEEDNKDKIPEESSNESTDEEKDELTIDAPESTSQQRVQVKDISNKKQIKNRPTEKKNQIMDVDSERQKNMTNSDLDSDSKAKETVIKLPSLDKKFKKDKSKFPVIKYNKDFSQVKITTKEQDKPRKINMKKYSEKTLNPQVFL